MSLRKVAALLAAFGLMVGLIANGVGANFTDQVQAIQNINVGTFGCSITSATPGAIVAGKTVTYSGTLTSSAAGQALFDFTVAPTGSIGVHAVVSVATAPVSPFSAVMPTPTAYDIAVGSSQTFSGAGMSWPTLNNDQLGHSYSVTFAVNCTDQGGGFSSNVIFDNTPITATSNLPSYGPQAYAFNEWGGGVTFAGTDRHLQTATVTMSSWACQSGSWDTGDCVTTPGATYPVAITFTVYNVASGVVGSQIASKTQTFAIPYRPSANLSLCPKDPTYYAPNAGKWWDGTSCNNGLATNITFTFTGQTLPNTAVFGITYNTQTSGYAPTGSATSPTNALNIATFPGTGTATQATIGTWLPDDLSSYVNPRTGGHAGDMETLTPVTQMPTGPSDNFKGYEPAVRITATN